MALAAKARVIDDTIGSDLDKANVKHLASKGLEHLSEEISHGIVKRAPIVLPKFLKFFKKLGPKGIPISMAIGAKGMFLKLACIASTAGACAGVGK